MTKFKNYINFITDDNKIFSKEDINRMSSEEIKNNKAALLAQNSQIGLPSNAELAASSNVVYVHEYTRSDGTHVKAHWRSLPDGGNKVLSSDEKELSNYIKLVQSIANKSGSTNNSTTNQSLTDKQIWNAVKSGYLQDDMHFPKNSVSQNTHLGAKEKALTALGEVVLYWANMHENKNYKFAQLLFSTAMTKASDLRSNENYSVADIKDINMLKNRNITFNNNAPVLIFYSDGFAVKAIKESEDMKRIIRKWLAGEKLDNKIRPQNFTVVLSDNPDISRAIHGATINNFKDNKDGTVSFYLTDYYDFEKAEYLFEKQPNNCKTKATTIANNMAYYLQQNKKLTNFNIVIPITLSKRYLK